MLHSPMISVLADSLGMWDMGPDAGDGDVKPLSKPELLQTSATPALKNQVTWDTTPQNLCHQNPQAKSGPSHLQTHHLNQDVTGTEVFRNKNSKNWGLILYLLKEK